MRKYINNVSAFQFYQLARYSTLVLTGIVFAKTTLSQQAIGEYETFIFLAGAVSFFWLNGLLKALLPLISRVDESKTALFSAFVLISVFSIITAFLLFLLHPSFFKFLLHGNDFPSLQLLLGYLIFGIPANLTEYFYLIKRKTNALVIYAIVSFLIQFLLVVLPVIFGYSIQMALLGWVVSAFLRYLWLWAIFFYYRSICFSFTFLKAHLKLGGPLVVAAFFSGSAQFVDGFIVTSRFDESTFAIFRYGARELPLAMLLANALSNAMLPDFAREDKLKENLKNLKRGVSRLMHLLFPLTTVFLLVSYPLFPILFNPRFQESAAIFNIYLLLIISRLIMPQTLLNGFRQTKEIMTASFFELLLNVSLSLFFVRFWGIYGIAFATFIAYLFEKMFLVVAVWRKFRIGLKDYLPIKYFIGYSVGIAVAFIFAEVFFS